VVDASTFYNMLLGCSSLNSLGAIVSTPHLALKFSSSSGDILTIHDNQKAAKECYMANLRLPYPPLMAINIEKACENTVPLEIEDLDPTPERLAFEVLLQLNCKLILYCNHKMYTFLT